MEAECLRKYIDELAHCLGDQELLLLVATQLYSRGIILAETKTEIAYSDNVSYKIIIKLLTEVEEFIETNPNQLNVVLETLKNHELCKNVAEKIHLDITYGNRVPPLSSHNALRLLQDSNFNVISHWHQLGGDLGVSLDERRKYQEQALRTQNYDGALEECLDAWIRNMPDPSWEVLIQAVERHEISTSDRMRDLLKFPRFQRSTSNIESRFSRLPRQGSSFESVIDHNDETSLTPSIPFCHVPSPSSAGVNISHPPINDSNITDLSIQAQSVLVVDTSPSSSQSASPQLQRSSSPLVNISVLDNSSSNETSTTSNTTSNDKCSNDVSTLNDKCSNDVGASNDKCSNDVIGKKIQDTLIKKAESNDSPQFHMECQLINSTTKQVIKSSQTSQANVTSPIYRDIKIKKVTKYNTIPPLTPLTVTVTVNQLCHLYVINIGSSGNMSTLVPNELDDVNEAKPGQTIQFPPEGAEYVFELDNNSGTEIVIVLGYCSRVTVEHAESDCERIRNNNRVAVERDIKIKKKNVIVPIGTVEMQFSVHV